MKKKVFCASVILMTFCALNALVIGAEAAARSNNGQGRGQQQEPPRRLEDAHAQYHNGKPCPNPKTCEFFKKKTYNGKNGSGAPDSSRPTPPDNGQGKGQQQEPPHRLQDAHAQYHNGKACPNPQTCDFFKKKTNVAGTPTSANRHINNGQGRGTQQDHPHRLHDAHTQYHNGKACPNPKTCDFFKKIQNEGNRAAD